MAELYEDADITIKTDTEALHGKALAVEKFEWNTYTKLFAPVYNVNKRYQVIGNTTGSLLLRGIELPKTTQQDCYRIISENPVSITISKDGNILASITTAYPDSRTLPASPPVEGIETPEKVFMEVIGFFILQ